MNSHVNLCERNIYHLEYIFKVSNPPETNLNLKGHLGDVDTEDALMLSPNILYDTCTVIIYMCQYRSQGFQNIFK